VELFGNAIMAACHVECAGHDIAISLGSDAGARQFGTNLLTSAIGMSPANPTSASMTQPAIQMLTRGFVVVAVGLVASIAASPVSAARNYTATPLGTLGGPTSTGYGINNLGDVTGFSSAGNSFHAFLYTGGVLHDLGTLGGPDSHGYGVNDSGQVTGWAQTTFALHAFLYSAGVMQDLGTLAGEDSRGIGINASGQITGFASTAGNATTHAFLYSGGSLVDLGALGGATSTGSSINIGGQVTGSATLPTFASHAFLYSDGTMHDLGTLGGTQSFGTGINARGQVAGYSDIAGNAHRHAFLYSDGTMLDLGTAGGADSFAYGINASGQVVGQSSIANPPHAIIYSEGVMYDLNPLVVSGLAGATLVSANAINDRGQIAATGCNNVGCQAYRLDPVADPVAAPAIPTLSGWALRTTALLLLGAVLLRWRRSA
jgi:probable HAF family extracellular repeat protein